MADLDELDLNHLTLEVIALAKRAGDRIMSVYQGEFEIEEKADSTPLTTADLAAHNLIVQGLNELPISIPILSEESASIPFNERTGWETYWLVDPLDGTREFIKRNGEFSVNIALIHNRLPVIGVVYAPVMDLLYYARRGSGAWKQRGMEPPTKIHVRNAPQNVTVARSRAPGTGPMLRSFLDNLGQHREVSMGSALKSCLVAEGIADVYARLGPTSEWDTGAAQCIVEEAGGHIVDTNDKDLRYNTKESLLNPHFLVYGDDSKDWIQYLPEAAKA